VSPHGERYILLYDSPPASRARVPELFPTHNAYADAFRARHPDALVMIGPFPEPEEGQPGALSIFMSREAAEEFAASDPFVVNDVVTWRVRKWLISPKDFHGPTRAARAVLSPSLPRRRRVVLTPSSPARAASCAAKASDRSNVRSRRASVSR
jgi:uncharacterized protein YciI